MVEASLTYIDRGTIRADMNFMLQSQTVASAVDPNPDAQIGEGPVYNVVIDHPEATILWDSGSHPDAGNGYWPAELYAAFEHADAADRDLETALGEEGYAIEDIDAVVQTHLHLDHAGGLRHFDGTDVPIYVHEEELKFAYYSANTEFGSSAYVLDDFDHDLNWQLLYRSKETHFEDIEFLHLPGHTPGLVGMMVHLDEAGTVIFTGDEAYVEENYVGEHPMGGELLWSKRDWFDSLQWVKDLERRYDATVICGHDPRHAEQFRSGL